MNIPKKFYNHNDPDYPVLISNIGDLKQALSEIPDDLDDLRVATIWGDDVQLQIINMGAADPYLTLDECEEEDDDD